MNFDPGLFTEQGFLDPPRLFFVRYILTTSGCRVCTVEALAASW